MLAQVMADLDAFVRRYVLREKPVLVKELLRHDPKLQRWPFHGGPSYQPLIN